MAPLIQRSKFKHFYFNKYVVTPFANRKYYLSYDYTHKALWYRVYKVATRSIDHHLKDGSKKGNYIYSSAVGYIPSQFKDYFKFAFVRNPETRFISAWKDKVLRQNYFKFSDEVHSQMQTLGNFIGWVKDLDVYNCDEHLLAQSALIDLNHVDFLGRFESFEEDFGYVAKKLNLKNFEPVHLNSTPPIDEEQISLQNRWDIYQIYKKDYQLFYPNTQKALLTEALDNGIRPA